MKLSPFMNEKTTKICNVIVLAIVSVAAMLYCKMYHNAKWDITTLPIGMDVILGCIYVLTISIVKPHYSAL